MDEEDGFDDVPPPPPLGECTPESDFTEKRIPAWGLETPVVTNEDEDFAFFAPRGADGDGGEEASGDDDGELDGSDLGEEEAFFDDEL